MKTGANGLALIKSFEGLFLQAYDDYNDQIVKPGDRIKGTLTIGWGHTTSAGHPTVFVGQVITRAGADSILASDLASVEREVEQVVKVPINQNQFDALVSFEYNTGWLEHPHCSLLSALNSGNYTLAEADFALYNRSSGRILSGLVRRRAAERALFHKPMVTK